jgi:hypothetical protein
VHAHTGVKTHLIGPGRGRMVARVDRWSPTQSRAWRGMVERHPIRGEASGEEGREGREPHR